VGVCAIYEHFSGFELFRLPNIVHALPHAGNANCWTANTNEAHGDKMNIIEDRPTTEEFIGLITDVGWDKYTNLKVLDQALKNSLYCVVARNNNGEAVGMGRLVGDGVRSVYFQDIIIKKKHQRQGIGSKIMDKLFDWINANCPNKTYLHLFTDKTTAGFYARYGFSGPESPFFGMSQKKFSKKLGKLKK